MDIASIAASFISAKCRTVSCFCRLLRTTLCYQLQPAINDLYDSIALFSSNVMSCVIASKQASLSDPMPSRPAYKAYQRTSRYPGCALNRQVLNVHLQCFNQRGIPKRHESYHHTRFLIDSLNGLFCTFTTSCYTCQAR